MMAFALKVIQKHTPPVISILLTIIGGTFYIAQTVNTGFDTMKADLIAEAREPAYAIMLSSLDKQVEKLDGDVSDIKDADVKFLYNQCNGEFGSKYLPSLPPSTSRSAKRTCQMLEEVYFTRRPF